MASKKFGNDFFAKKRFAGCDCANEWTRNNLFENCFDVLDAHISQCNVICGRILLDFMLKNHDLIKQWQGIRFSFIL